MEEQDSGSGGLSRRRVLQAFYATGAVLVGLAFFLFFASNPRSLSQPAKIGIVLCLIPVLNIAGWYLRDRRQYRILGETFFLVSGFAFGAGIWLIAQIFHFPMHYSWGFLLWLAGIFPLALLSGSATLTAICAALPAVWLLTLTEMHWHPATFRAAATLWWYIPILAPILRETYRRKNAVALVFCALGVFPFLTRVGDVLGRPGRFDQAVLLSYGFLLYTLGLLHDNTRAHFAGRILRFLGLLTVLFFSITFAWDGSNWRIDRTGSMMLIAIGACAAVPASILSMRGRREALALLCALLIEHAAIFYLAGSEADPSSLRHIPVFVSMAFFLAAAYASRTVSLYYTACVCVGLTVASWYFAATRTFLMSGAIAFAGFGIIMVLSTFLWDRVVRRQARYLRADAGDDHDS